MKKITVLFIFTWFSALTYGQAPTFINGPFNINVGAPVTWYGDVTFGPNAIVYLEDGATAIFYGRNMTVDAGATFIALPGNGQIGTGTIIFRDNNPNYINYPLQQTLNGNFTSGNDPTLLNVEVDNAAGLALAGHTRISNEVKFTRGHLFLNNFNLVIGSSASLVNYNVNRHVVTNGTGLLVKEGLQNNSTFIFPVGIAAADFTPATITNTAATRSISLQVKDYSSSGGVETGFAQKGMERTWQISSNINGPATITLQHNAATNANGSGTNQSAFNNTVAYVSQQLSPGIWSQNCNGTNGGSPVSINTGNNMNLPATTDATAYFTKRTVDCTDLMVTKTVNNVAPIVGSNLNFTVLVRNNGIGEATGVQVIDQLPSGYTYVNAAATTGSYNNVTGVWMIGNLANGATASIVITARVNTTGIYGNKATVSGNETDSDLANNESIVTPVPGIIQANLGVVKSVNVASPTVGSSIVFSIAIRNTGPNNASNVRVTDVLTAGYTYVNSTVTTGSFDPISGTWTIGGFANGATAIMNITAVVNAIGPYSNTATIAGAEVDPVPGDNTSTISTFPNARMVDLQIKKTSTLNAIAIGEEFDYNIEITNKSGNLATQVTVNDPLPPGLTFIASQSAYGVVNYALGTRVVNWFVGDLAGGAKLTLVIRVKANVPGVITNTAVATGNAPEADAADNSSTFDREILNIRIPNVITPDGDGKNDTFKIPGLFSYPENTLKIFNRWGNEVWYSKGASYAEDWNGEGLNEGTYCYLLRLKDKTGNFQVFKGWVTLLKD